MQMRDGVLELSGVRGLSLHQDCVSWTDSEGNKLQMPLATVFTLYEGVKLQATKYGQDWQAFEDAVFERQFEINKAKNRATG